MPSTARVLRPPWGGSRATGHSPRRSHRGHADVTPARLLRATPIQGLHFGPRGVHPSRGKDGRFWGQHQPDARPEARQGGRPAPRCAVPLPGWRAARSGRLAVPAAVPVVQPSLQALLRAFLQPLIHSLADHSTSVPLLFATACAAGFRLGDLLRGACCTRLSPGQPSPP